MENQNHIGPIYEFPESALDSVIKDAVERILAMPSCPRFGLRVAVDNALWESLVMRMYADPCISASLTEQFHLDVHARVSVHSTLHALRRTDIPISPAAELRLAMSVASFLSVGAEWVIGELRERGYGAGDRSAK